MKIKITFWFYEDKIRIERAINIKERRQFYQRKVQVTESQTGNSILKAVLKQMYEISFGRNVLKTTFYSCGTEPKSFSD